MREEHTGHVQPLPRVKGTQLRCNPGKPLPENQTSNPASELGAAEKFEAFNHRQTSCSRINITFNSSLANAAAKAHTQQRGAVLLSL